MIDEKSVTLQIGGRDISFSTKKVAKQADGAFWVRYGDSVVLVTACMDNKRREGVDFLPFTVDYREYTFAGGKIPGGFFKREGRPTDSETLVCRLIDRPMRPLFPEGFRNETQVIAMVLSTDFENSPDVMAINGASFALYCSRIPFNTPVGAVRVGIHNGEYVVNPSLAVFGDLTLNIIVAGTRDAICMVESGAKEVSEAAIVKALEIAHAEIKKLVQAQEEVYAQLGVVKEPFAPIEHDSAEFKEIEAKVAGPIRQAMEVRGKKEMYKAIDEALALAVAGIDEADEDRIARAEAIAEDVLVNVFRKMVIEDGRRADGRLFDEIRPVWSEVGVLPRTHGSALFQRGETMALANCTLGTTADVQRLSGLLEGTEKHFLLHYNFPPFSVGEVKPIRGPGRREVGHGALAERALSAVVPDDKDFPYVIRVVSDIMESNGSSSQATICGGSLALMDAGVPIKAPVAGVAMGLIMENGKYSILSDIAGLEDHYGDMDFKVAGTREGITALQMDIKVSGISFDIMREALEQARKGRLHLLDEMAKTLEAPRPDISPLAPRIFTIEIPRDRIGELIGPGGKNVRMIQEKTGVEINIEDDGRVMVASNDAAAAERALEMIRGQMEVPEVGKVYHGIVKRIEAYGAFIEILPGQDGLLHVSEIDWKRVEKVEDYMKIGDAVDVQVLEYENNGKMRLSRKPLIPKPEGYVEKPERKFDKGDRPRRPSSRDGGDRGFKPRRPKHD
ncbi:MAG TPA: polyribonucleotide nucleotidyltransferase [Acidobacteriota bacterium]|jgi:polyribonucleotide nucleotidyltransferase|nr:polyribonucleotide nucleotidyltransferase [Acidobacteriota bacterium]HNT17536.1 polyribonucleotide nucleotidyltransferase [Acidobacteriota bacterium]HQO19866.1 polyribonucleotide nucleotidyltransferase [Acidobacteriota bacterium]HQQ47281.1 polyribonucleotide nucleotidyltransferase [Acidobacteriota bacterium]